MFNKCVRKLEAHLTRVVEADAEATLLAPRSHLREAARAASGMVPGAHGGGSVARLDDDLEDGAAEAIQRHGLNGGPRAGSAQSAAAAAAAAVVMADPELAQYAVKGEDADWAAALGAPGSKGKSVSNY